MKAKRQKTDIEYLEATKRFCYAMICGIVVVLIIIANLYVIYELFNNFHIYASGSIASISMSLNLNFWFLCFAAFILGCDMTLVGMFIPRYL